MCYLFFNEMHHLNSCVQYVSAVKSRRRQNFSVKGRPGNKHTAFAGHKLQQSRNYSALLLQCESSCRSYRMDGGST